MTVSTLKSREAMLDLRTDWCELAQLHQNPLLEYEWFDSCMKTIHRNDSLRLLVMRNSNGEVSAIAPLVKARRNSREWIEFIGTSTLHEPSGMLYRDSIDLQPFYQAIARSREPAFLGRISADSQVCATIPRRMSPSGLWLRTDSAATPVLKLDKGWEVFFRSMSTRRQSDYRRAAKRAQSLGESHFEIRCPKSQQVLPLLEIAFEIEDRSWKGANGSSLKRNESLAAFIKEYAASAASQGHLRLFFQHLGGKPAAMAICIEKYNALWFLKIGYDEAFRNYSPGTLQLMNIIAYCCENRISRIEHLGAFEPWLAPWTTYVTQHVSYIHYPLNSLGARLFSRDISRAMRNRIARAFRKLPGTGS